MEKEFPLFFLPYSHQYFFAAVIFYKTNLFESHLDWINYVIFNHSTAMLHQDYLLN